MLALPAYRWPTGKVHLLAGREWACGRWTSDDRFPQGFPEPITLDIRGGDLALVCHGCQQGAMRLASSMPDSEYDALALGAPIVDRRTWRIHKITDRGREWRLCTGYLLQRRHHRLLPGTPLGSTCCRLCWPRSGQPVPVPAYDLGTVVRFRGTWPAIYLGPVHGGHQVRLCSLGKLKIAAEGEISPRSRR